VLVVLQGVMLRGAFALSPASAQVEGLARQYLGIRIWGAPATIALFAVTGWLIALERTRAVLVIQVVMNGLNVGLDLWFVLHLGWGVPGVATATLIAEWSGLALGLWLCRDAFGPVLRAAWARVGDRAALWLMFTVNRDILIRSMALQLCYVTFVFLGARFGDVTLAANQVLMLFLELTAYALDGFAFAAEALVGQSIGARLPAQTRRAAVLTSQWGVGGAVLMGLTFWLAGPAIIDLMTTAPDVRAESRTYLLWFAESPVIGISAWMLDGSFIGATLTQAMRRAALQSVAVYAVAVVVLVPGLGNHGLWAALMVLNVTRAITLGLRFSQVAAKASGADQPERH
jgi:MATE family multidrug resistance protein